jgi:hypothetical protein
MLWVFRVKGSEDFSFDARKLHGVLSVVKERFPDDWHPFRDDFLPDDDRVRANFLLCMCIHSQMEEMEQIVEINLPVRLGIRREWKILARLLARNTSY